MIRSSSSPRGANGPRCAGRSRSAPPRPACRISGSRCAPRALSPASRASTQSAVTLTVGVQAETRIVPAETKPDCPFPAQLELVPQMEQGRVNIAVPIDVPFTEVNRLLEAQLKGKTFPRGQERRVRGHGPQRQAGGVGRSPADLARACGPTRQKSWFGLGAEATVHVWGRPVLDRERQMLRLADVALDVELEAAFGLLGAAARAAVPYLEDGAGGERGRRPESVAASARKSIETAIADFRKSADGVRVDAAVTRCVSSASSSTPRRCA